MSYHNPIMLAECIEALDIKADGVYVDVTFGGGGHSKSILEKLNSNGKLIAFDQDADAIGNKLDDARFTFVNQNFRFMQQSLKFLNVLHVDGILADLGVSSYQFDTPQRGFSTRFDSALDMRMNSGLKKTAQLILNTYSAEQLQNIFSAYGEIRNAKTLANTIIEFRMQHKLESTANLKEAIDLCRMGNKEQQYYAQVFQALRIEVNDELEVLKALLLQSKSILKTNGRLVVLTYHSLEDRLVKNFIAKGNFEGTDETDFYGNRINVAFKSISKKPLIPEAAEVKLNPRARSAKLRIAEKI